VGVEGRWGIADNTNDLNILNKEKKGNKKNGNDESTKTKHSFRRKEPGGALGRPDSALGKNFYRVSSICLFTSISTFQSQRWCNG
jgi:hypothetical protein